jgi:hypothetical protein
MRVIATVHMPTGDIDRCIDVLVQARTEAWSNLPLSTSRNLYRFARSTVRFRTGHLPQLAATVSMLCELQRCIAAGIGDPQPSVVQSGLSWPWPSPGQERERRCH